MPINQTLICAALTLLLSSPSFAVSHTQAIESQHGHSLTDYGSFSQGYMGAVSDLAPTQWSAPKSGTDAAIARLREMMGTANVTANDLRQATATSENFFREHGIQPPNLVRLVLRHDPEDGRGYLRMELPVNVGSSEELADLDFELSMRVAQFLVSGSDNLVISVVRA